MSSEKLGACCYFRGSKLCSDCEKSLDLQVHARITQARREGIIEGFAAGCAGHWSDDIPSEFIDKYNSVDDYLKEKERDGK